MPSNLADIIFGPTAEAKFEARANREQARRAWLASRLFKVGPWRFYGDGRST